jgi:hypothetical protein
MKRINRYLVTFDYKQIHNEVKTIITREMDLSEEAKSIEKMAGFRKIEKFPTLKLFYNSGERHQLIMERLANRWRESLGVKVELNPMDWKVLVSTLHVSGKNNTA